MTTDRIPNELVGRRVVYRDELGRIASPEGVITRVRTKFVYVQWPDRDEEIRYPRPSSVAIHDPLVLVEP